MNRNYEMVQQLTRGSNGAHTEIIGKGTLNPITLQVGPNVLYKREMLADLQNLGRMVLNGIESKSGNKITDFYNIDNAFNYWYQQVPQEVIMKRADSPFNTSVTGFVNYTYGQDIIPQFSLDSSTLGILPKRPYERQGIRLRTTRLFATGTGGYTEGAVLPDSKSVTLDPIKIPMATIAQCVNYTTLMEFTSRYNDSVQIPEAIRAMIMDEFVKTISESLYVTPNNAQSTQVESLLRCILSNAEFAAKSYTAGYEDPWTNAASGIDRSSAGPLDSYVSYASSNRDFTPDLVDAAIASIFTKVPGGFNPKDYVVLLPKNLQQSFAYNYSPNQFYEAGAAIVGGVNGVQQVSYDTGFVVGGYQGIPFIPIVDAPSDTAIMVNLKHCWLEMGIPPMVLEYGLRRGDPSGINFIGNEALIFSLMNLAMDNFSCQAKWMNLQ